MSPDSATSAARFLPRSAGSCPTLGLGELRHVESTGSTNADLAAEAAGGETDPSVLVADHQTAGRGRLDRRWETAPGAALLVSIRMPVAHDSAAQEVRALGAAARAVLDDRIECVAGAKWPNDVVVSEGDRPGKLAGVLAEFVAGPVPCVIVGIGINLTAAEGQPAATSVAECGGDPDRDEVLAELLAGFAERRSDPAAVLDELRRHSATLGRRVRAELPGGGEIIGTASRLDDDGSLVVTDDAGTAHTLGTADIVHLRPA